MDVVKKRKSWKAVIKSPARESTVNSEFLASIGWPLEDVPGDRKARRFSWSQLWEVSEEESECRRWWFPRIVLFCKKI